MTAIKTSASFGVLYAVPDLSGNEVTLRNDATKLPAGTPTVGLWASGSRMRLSQANATAWGANGPAIPSTMADADGNILSFAAPVTPYYLGGNSQGAASGTRLYVGGGYADLTAGNLTDMGTVLAGFASTGALS